MRAVNTCINEYILYTNRTSDKYVIIIAYLCLYMYIANNMLTPILQAYQQKFPPPPSICRTTMLLMLRALDFTEFGYGTRDEAHQPCEIYDILLRRVHRASNRRSLSKLR